MTQQDKRKFLVQYRMHKDAAMITCNITTSDTQELHRCLVQMTNYQMPVQMWDTCVVHETVGEGGVKEYGKAWLGGMYDEGFNFKSDIGGSTMMLESIDSRPLFTKGLTPTTTGRGKQARSTVLLANFFFSEEPTYVH